MNFENKSKNAEYLADLITAALLGGRNKEIDNCLRENHEKVVKQYLHEVNENDEKAVGI